MAVTFFDPDDRYIWALAVNSRGDVYAGTGDKGVIYKITPDGKGTPFYSTKSTHATALAIDRSGNLLVGTESPGKVIRIDADGKGFVLLDTPYQEIRSLRFDDKGQLFAAALNGRPGGAAPTSQGLAEPVASETGRALVPSVSVSTEITSIAIVDGGAASTPSSANREDRRASKGALYRIMPDGLWDLVWDSREDVPYDVTFDRTGAPIIATGNKGKLYRLEGEPLRPTLLTRASAQQVTGVLQGPARPGLFRDRQSREALPVVVRTRTTRHVRIRTERRADARNVGHAQLATAPFPRAAGSSWRREAATPRPRTKPGAHGRRTPSRPTAPPSQVRRRGICSGAPCSRAAATGPVLTSVTAAYLQRNLRPVVRSITVHPPGIVFQKPFTTGEPDLAGFGDQTTPDRRLTHRRADDARVVLVARARPAHVSEGAADARVASRRRERRRARLQRPVSARRRDRHGRRFAATSTNRSSSGIRRWFPTARTSSAVVASDSPSNPASAALTGERDSSAFLIDHTPPAIVVSSVRTEGARTTLVFDVNDADSPVSRVEYSRDGGVHWTAVFPKDGIADSKSERYEVTIDGEDRRRRPHDSSVGLDEQHRHDARAPPRRQAGSDSRYVLLRTRSGGCLARTVVWVDQPDHIDGNREALSGRRLEAGARHRVAELLDPARLKRPAACRGRSGRGFRGSRRCPRA